MEGQGQSIPPGQMPQGDERDLVLDSDEIQTLEHGGYGGEGELEYTDRPPEAARPAREYLNQTDMTDETGDRSLSEHAERSTRPEQSQTADEGSTDDRGSGGR